MKVNQISMDVCISLLEILKGQEYGQKRQILTTIIVALMALRSTYEKDHNHA